MPPRRPQTQTLDSLLPPILSLLPNTYSAHQKALTTTARLVHAGQHALAVEILFATAKELLKLGEPGSGSELGVRMVAVMGEGSLPVAESTRTNITQLLALTPPSGPWRKKLADAAVKWSQAHGECPTGDPSLHQYLGEMYYKERSFVLAEQHLLASGKRDAAATLADMMYEWCNKGALDPGPYALRGTLPPLMHSPPSILPSLTFLTTFLSHLSSPTSAFRPSLLTPLPSHTSSSLPDVLLSTSPSLNFCQLALLTVQRAPPVGVSAVEARGLDGGVGREWRALCARYSRASGGKGVVGQQEVQEAISQIATEVFHMQAPRSQGGNDLLQNLMGSLFGGGGGGGGQQAIGGR